MPRVPALIVEQRTAGRNPTLIVRADGDARMGFGHLVRSLALAQAWSARGGEAILVTAAHEVRPHRADPCAEVVRLRAAFPDPSDLATMREVSAKLPGVWICCDGYHFDVTYTAALRSFGGRVLLLDDEATRGAYEADVVLNQNLGAEALAYPRTHDAPRLLLGPRYALLRPEFRWWADRVVDTPPRVRRVLVVMGGSDPHRQTIRVARVLRALTDSDLELVLVLGRGHPDTPAIADMARHAIAPRITLQIDPDDMAAVMAGVDMAISGAGTTCWELCAMALPSVLVTLAENQVRIAQALAKAGAAVDLGRWDRVADRTLVSTVAALIGDRSRRLSLAREAKALVDGRGAARVVAALLCQPGKATFVR